MFLLIFMVIVLLFSLPKPEQTDDVKKRLTERLSRQCPPHKWRYEEIKDDKGDTKYWYLKCDVCGPLKPLE